MGIVDEDIARVRAASDIVQVISQHTQLRKVGRQWSGLCPFHNEKSPSFSVNGAEGLYYCFGCQKSGDVITFVREIEHLDFAAAVEWLAGRAGITLTYTDPDQGEGRKKKAKLYAVMERSVDWYHQRLPCLRHRLRGKCCYHLADPACSLRSRCQSLGHQCRLNLRQRRRPCHQCHRRRPLPLRLHCYHPGHQHHRHYPLYRCHHCRHHRPCQW